MGPSRLQHQHPQFQQTVPINKGSTRQCPLLWSWVLEKEGTLEITERLANKQHGTRDLPKYGPLEGNLTLACLLLIMVKPKVTGGAQMRSSDVYARVVDSSSSPLYI